MTAGAPYGAPDFNTGTRAHARRLVDSGMTVEALAQRARMGVGDMRAFLDGTRVNVQQAARIVAVPLDHGTMPACGVVRRMQALQVRGWTIGAMAKVWGVDTDRIRMWKRQQTVRTDEWLIVRDLFDMLSNADPLSFGVTREWMDRASKRASLAGYLPASAWADIDDPDCQPEVRRGVA